MTNIINPSPKIGALEIVQHFKELNDMKIKGKHTMYNGLMLLFRRKKIRVQTIGARVISCNGLLNGIWFRPDGMRCHVFLCTWHPKYNKGVTSFDFVVDYNCNKLFDKLLKHGVISAGTHEYLTTENKD